MADFSVVMDKLQGFETADSIAEFFRGYGIKARPGKSNQCAISEFISIETDVLAVILTTVGAVSVYESRVIADDLLFRMECTTAMSEFINNFDAGRYPDLIIEY